MRKDGSIVRIAYSSAPFDLPDGQGSVTAWTDMEEQLEAEQAARDRDIAEARADELRAARRRIIEAADAARARVTRDLHDGAQQQFVSAVLTLQLAERQADARRGRSGCGGPRSSRPAPASRTCATSRPASTRGSSRTAGSGPRSTALASRLPLPIAVDDRLDRRLPAPVEASLYFFVSEALTNVVKHARSERRRGPDRARGRPAWSST